MTPKRPRRRYPAEGKAEVALAALTGRGMVEMIRKSYKRATAKMKMKRAVSCQETALSLRSHG